MSRCLDKASAFALLETAASSASLAGPAHQTGARFEGGALTEPRGESVYQSSEKRLADIALIKCDGQRSWLARARAIENSTCILQQTRATRFVVRSLRCVTFVEFSGDHSMFASGQKASCISNNNSSTIIIITSNDIIDTWVTPQHHQATCRIRLGQLERNLVRTVRKYLIHRQLFDKSLPKSKFVKKVSVHEGTI